MIMLLYAREASYTIMIYLRLEARRSYVSQAPQHYAKCSRACRGCE